MANPDMLLTKAGLNVLSQGLTGERILFTRVAIGDGEFNYDTESVLDLTAMRNWRKDLPITACEVVGNGMVNLVAYETNSDVAEGFWEREHAIFAQDPITGDEVLYSYRNFGSECSFIPSNTGSVLKDILVGFETVIQNAAHVEAVLDLNFSYVSQIDYKSHVESEHPHPNTPNHYLNVSDADKFWVTNNDNHLHQISVDNVKEILLGDVTAKISGNESKIKELEIFTLAKNELGLDANLMIVEDFKPATEVDNFSVKVVSCARGGRLIGVETDDGIRIGTYYWITDGVNQELVQVKGVTYSTDYYHVTLAQGLTYDYNASAVKLYRTTYKDFGVVDKKSLSWSGQTFRGIEANIERTLTLETTNSNKAAFNVSGEGLLTTDGYFTLTQDKGRLVVGGTEVEETTTSTETSTVPSGNCDCNCSCCAMSATCTMSGAGNGN